MSVQAWTMQDELEQVIGEVLDGTAYRELPTETLKLMLANAVHALLNSSVDPVLAGEQEQVAPE